MLNTIVPRALPLCARIRRDRTLVVGHTAIVEKSQVAFSAHTFPLLARVTGRTVAVHRATTGIGGELTLPIQAGRCQADTILAIEGIDAAGRDGGVRTRTAFALVQGTKHRIITGAIGLATARYVLKHAGSRYTQITGAAVIVLTIICRRTATRLWQMLTLPQNTAVRSAGVRIHARRILLTTALHRLDDTGLVHTDALRAGTFRGAILIDRAASRNHLRRARAHHTDPRHTRIGGSLTIGILGTATGDGQMGALQTVHLTGIQCTLIAIVTIGGRRTATREGAIHTLTANAGI